MNPANHIHHHRGFTLVEVLVAISIILVLASLITWGFRHAHEAASRRASVVDLKMCQDLVQEYVNANDLRLVEGPQVPQALQNPPPGAPTSLPVYSDAGARYGKAEIQLDDLRSYGSSDLEDKMSSRPPRYYAQAVTRTGDVMWLLLRDPKNRAMISALPPKRILEAQAVNGQRTPSPIDRAVVLDENGNPVVFVPAGGIHTMMTVESVLRECVVRTSGVYVVDDPNKPVPPVSAADRPFWASAGQDGDLTKGDDNLYSFQQ